MRAVCLVAPVVAGIVSVAGFAPFGLGIVPVASFAAWFALTAADPPARAARSGYLFGLGYFGAGVSWIQVSAHQFGVPLYTFSVSVTVAFVAFLALYPALAAYVASRAIPAAAGIAARLIALALAFVIVEGLRGYLLTGFPWLAVGYSQTDGPFRGLVPIGGTYAASAAVTLAAALGALALRVPARRRAALVALAVLVVGSIGLSRLEFTEKAGAPFTVAVVQGNVPQARKWLASERATTIRRYFELSKAPIEAGVAAVIWPETAIPAFADEVPDVLGRLHGHGQDSGVTFLVGIPRRLPDPEQPEGTPRYFNSVVELGGDDIAWYDKRHLVPFGEYLPLEWLIRAPLAALGVRLADFSPGPDEQALLEVDGHPLGVSICYEDVFAREVNRALPKARFLVNVSNDAWFGDSLAPHQHMQIARMRALETGRTLVRATNTGVSAVADHRGRITARSPQFETDVLVADVTPRRGTTPYLRIGDAGVLGMLVVAFAAVLVVAHRRAATR